MTGYLAHKVSLYYYHYDGLGSVAALSNTSGDIVERYEYRRHFIFWRNWKMVDTRLEAVTGGEAATGGWEPMYDAYKSQDAAWEAAIRAKREFEINN